MRVFVCVCVRLCVKGKLQTTHACVHAAGNLGVSVEEINDHIGWDIGAGWVRAGCQGA